MDELVDILDEAGNYTGTTAFKSEAHLKGLFHPTVHVWCYTKNGKILLQQRGANKETYPLKWDVSVAGHIGAGEEITQGAVREVLEEIGVVLKVSDLEKIDVHKTEKRHSNTIWDREFNHTFLTALEETTVLIKQEEEVEALAWISLASFENMIFNDNTGLVPNSKKRYERIIAAVRSRI
ncbi:NUDIX hydrolase [Croceivirga thetidis]|uniref:NUDIX domain-containing protein n=1 Tax=Croceivirga thetidis TaxID=2721623 RepID=A0ABX1GUJ9_9FLAO|nr:NUDIX domain-containing protein [Croceivirga thetidis]NKI32595.1 NUDIX domain-containing protein [Croceivirga thetidis]